MSVLDWRFEDAPIVVVDVETTGFNPQSDRIVEVAAIRVPDEPSENPEILVNTLVNPQQPVRATRVYGIRNEDVVTAPTIPLIAGAIAWVDEQECQHLALVRDCLHRLGWAPGDPMAAPA